MLSNHDKLLLQDLRLQPLWLLWVYVVTGLAAAGAGLAMLDWRLEAVACVGGGFLLALGAEKLVTRRIRIAASRVVMTTQ